MKKLSALALSILLAAGAAFAEAEVRTVAAVYKDKATLAGKEVAVQGKVVKVNNGIMGRNFVHVQDGSGEPGSTNNLIVTSKQTAAVGETVKVSGKVVLNRDFGAGYMYPLLLEETTITPAK